MKTNRDRKIELIAKWVLLLEKMQRINKMLFKDTELYEGKYETSFDEELHAFFSARITQFGKWRNELFGKPLKDCKEGQKPIPARLCFEDKRDVLHMIVLLGD